MGTLHLTQKYVISALPLDTTVTAMEKSYTRNGANIIRTHTTTALVARVCINVTRASVP